MIVQAKLKKSTVKKLMNRGVMFLPSMLRALLGLQLVAAAASEVVLGSQMGNDTVPSVASPVSCNTSCGDLTFTYPFGIGAQCSRGLDFALTCNESAQPPVLLLRDGITQVVSNIFVATHYYYDQYVGINIHSTIPVSYGVNVYNMSWTSPGKSFVLADFWLNVTGCNFDIFFTNLDVNMTSLVCTLTCPTRDITDMEARQTCNGTGCCTISWEVNIRAFNLKFVRHGESNPWAGALYNRSSLWDFINVTTSYDGAALSWNNATFACVGNNSRCIDNEYSQYSGYSCLCNPGYVGNPYLLDGCTRDIGYNPAAQQKANCSRACGTITVPFPFGVEEGCYARKQFYLNCTNVTTSTLQLEEPSYLVTEINIDEGLITYTIPDEDEGSVDPLSDDDPGIFVSLQGLASFKWVVANLTCSEAQANSSGYACVSANSNCIPVNSTSGYVGY